MREVSPNQGSGGEACHTTEPAQTQEQTGVEAHSKPKATPPKSARPRFCSRSRSRSHTVRSKRQPWALSSDSEISSDDSTGSASHPGCWLIPIIVEGVNTLALIDTGASVTMMGRPLYPKVQHVRALKLQTHDMPRLEVVGGNPVPMLGCAEVGVGIAAGVYRTPVVVSARKERPNFIIGADFLSTHDCDLSLRQKLFMLGRNSVQCLPERVRSSHARLKLARRVKLPPHLEVLVSCKATQSIKHFGTSCAVAQPANNSWHYAEDGLVIGSSLVTPDKATHHIPVMNLSDTTRTLPEGTRMGDIYPVESFKHV